ncbi:MAG: YjfB family protein [Synergistaceae bacterium]|jgi:hypothetical protein|nr:YjfB family protein [Synergistaceae bacterium]
MDITTGIAQASMTMSLVKVATEAQTAVLKNVMDTQKEALSILLQSLGVGQQINIQA